jgi:Acyl-coenzyme A:6-aminopenicillanic acid acyl-transferase
MVPWVERPRLLVDMAKPMYEQSFSPETVTSAKRLLESITAMIPGKARMLAQLARLRTWNRFHREVVGIARMADADWCDIMLANISYDLVLSSLGCSTIALPTKDGPVLARNMDWWPDDLLAQSSYLLCYQQAGATRFVNAGWPGSVGVVSGMSQRGFAVALNAVSCSEPFAKTGYPVLLHVRRVVEDAANFEEALTMLRDQRLTAPALFTLVGMENVQRVVIERTPTRHAIRRAENSQALLTTNDYRSLDKVPSRAEPLDGSNFYLSTCSRYDALCRFFANWSADLPHNITQLLYILSDPDVIQGITAQHVILHPRSQEMVLWVPRRLMAAPA